MPMLPTGFPQGTGGGLLGGAFSSWSVTSWQIIIHKLVHISLSARSPRSAWRHCSAFPRELVAVTSRHEWSSSSPSEGGDWVLDGSPTHHSHKGPHVGSGRGRSPYCNGFLTCKTIVLIAPHVVHCISCLLIETA